MKIFNKPQPPQSKMKDFRDFAVGLATLLGLGLLGWNLFTGGAETPVAVVQTDSSPELMAKAKAAAEREAAAEKLEADRIAADAAATQAAARAAAEKNAEEEAHEKRYGFHCLDSWNGSHPGLVKDVKQQLNDPRSFDHQETRTWPVQPDGRNRVMMTYRAKNALGSLVLAKATGSFDNETCVIDTETIQ